MKLIQKQKTMTLFRELDESEKNDFRKWARDNYKVHDPIKGVWHPEVQAECVRMNKECKTDIEGLLADFIKTNDELVKDNN